MAPTEATATSARVLLELRRVSRRFGGLTAVNQLTMSIARGSIHGLIGPNGSGKSTTFNVITGVTPASDGEVLFNGENITNRKPYQISRCGIARTFQATDLLPESTVLENILVAADRRYADGLWGTLFATRRYRKSRDEVIAWAEGAAGRLRLDLHRTTPVRDLPHRDQKAVALASALATDPLLLMLDEPAAGLTAEENDEMMDFYRSLVADGLTILLVEHNMRTVMSLCQRITVLNHSVKIAEGKAEEIAANPEVIEAYLGTPA